MGVESDFDLDALIGISEPSDAVGQNELADFLGLVPRTVRELAERGVIPKLGKNSYPLRESVRAYCASIRETASARSSSPNLTASRLRESQERADKLAFTNAAMRREFVPAKDVEHEWASILRDVRSAMLAIPSRIQSRLVTLSSRDIEIIDREIRNVLEESSQGQSE